MTEPLILLVTSTKDPALTADDRLLATALGERGYRAEPAVWDDPRVPWPLARLVVIRSTWDYHLRRDEFLQWTARTEQQTRLCNPAAVVVWNSHKGYLRELEAEGIALAPTEWLARGQSATLAGILEAHDWREAVMKPAVAASAHGALRVSAAAPPERQELAQQHLESLLARSDVMIQPYIPELGAGGEMSCMFIEGEHTHSVHRSSSLERSPEESAHGSPAVAGAEEKQLAERVLAAVRARFSTPLYLRVDLVRSSAFGVVLLECELIEPTLFLARSPRAVEGLVAGIEKRLLPSSALGPTRGG